MRVLVVTAPLLGHAYTLVPLAWELRTAGHDVLLATAGEALRAADAGLPVADLAAEFDLARTRRRTALRNPLLARADQAGRAGTRGVVTLFGEINDELADGAVAAADEWQPDLVIHDALAPVGALVAARCGVPAVVCDPTFYDGQDLGFATTGHLRYACGRHSIPEPTPPSAVVRLAPASMVGPRSGRHMRYVPYDGSVVLADWLTTRPPRPRVAVVSSLPTGEDPALMRAVARAAPLVDAEFVLVRPGLRRGPPLPDNVHRVEWAPLSRLLPHCAAVVHHGGAQVVLSTLVHGLPQLVVPDAADRRHNAGLVYARGVGLVSDRRRVDSGLLRRLLTQDALADAASQVRMEMTNATGTADVAAEVLALAGDTSSSRDTASAGDTAST